MAKSKGFSGPKYANGNYKSQQKAYNRTKKGLELRVKANRLRDQLKLKKGDPRDASHTGPDSGKPESRHANRSRPRNKA